MQHRCERVVIDCRQAVLVEHQDADEATVSERAAVDVADVVAPQLQVAHRAGQTTWHVAQLALGHVDVGQVLRVELELGQLIQRVAFEHEIHELGHLSEGALVDVRDLVVGEEQVAQVLQVPERDLRDALYVIEAQIEPRQLRQTLEGAVDVTQVVVGQVEVHERVDAVERLLGDGADVVAAEVEQLELTHRLERAVVDRRDVVVLQLQVHQTAQ